MGLYLLLEHNNPIGKFDMFCCNWILSVLGSAFHIRCYLPVGEAYTCTCILVCRFHIKGHTIGSNQRLWNWYLLLPC